MISGAKPSVDKRGQFFFCLSLRCLRGTAYQVGRGSLLLDGGQAGDGKIIAGVAALALLLLLYLPEALVLLVLARILAMEAAQINMLSAHITPFKPANK